MGVSLLVSLTGSGNFKKQVVALCVIEKLKGIGSDSLKNKRVKIVL
jgi:hypothetical protein